jgi:hypothetical protein
MNVYTRSGKLNFSFTAIQFFDRMSKKKKVSLYSTEAIDAENINEREKEEIEQCHLNLFD